MVEVGITATGMEHLSIGGDTFNASAMMALAGVAVEYSTKLGRDEYSELLQTEMGKLPLRLKFFEDESFNGSYKITNSADGERVFEYNRRGSAASKLSLEDLTVNYLDSTDGLYNSGITMALSKSTCECVIQLFQMAKKKNITTFFDVNFREKLWSKEKAAEMISKVLPSVDILFLSADDLEIINLIIKKDLNQFGIPVIERKGSEGCLIHNAGKSVLVSGVKATPVDTTGAGDIFSGAFIATYLRTKDLIQSAKSANKCAALHTEYLGGVPKQGIE